MRDAKNIMIDMPALKTDSSDGLRNRKPGE